MVVLVVLFAIPYIILHKSLTADEEENKYEQAHRWEQMWRCEFEKSLIDCRFIGLGFVAIAAQNILPYIKSYPLR